MFLKFASYLLAFLSLSNSVLGQVDVTTNLYGRTIYAEYSYTGFSNTWIGPFGASDIYFAEYDGYLRQVPESAIFDPANKVRLYVKDCGNGYACLMTRWREEQGYRYYLQADWLDVDFETTSIPTSATEFHWKIVCDYTSPQNYKVCSFGNRYYDTYGLAKIYGTNTYTLKTDWPGDNPYYWYQFRIVVPQAVSNGLVRKAQTPCNTGSLQVSASLPVSQGTAPSPGYWYQMTESLLDEVRSGFQAGLAEGSLSDSPSWSVELAGGIAFKEMRETQVNVTVRPGNLVFVEQLSGSYGPYTVLGVNVVLREEACF